MTQTVGEWIYEHRALLKNPKMSQSELAKRAGLSRAYISLLERGGEHPDTGHPVNPDPDALSRIALALANDNIEWMRFESELLKIAAQSAGYTRSKTSQGEVMREPSLTYEPMTEDEKEEIISSFEGKPRIARQVAKSALEAILSQYPDVETDRTTHGKAGVCGK